MAKKNNVQNVSVAKPKSGGAVFIAPAGTTLPSDAKSELPDTYKCMGCISEDGVVNTQESDSEDIADWEGKIVESPSTTYSETYTTTFIEAVNPDVLKYVYGDENVIIGSNGGLEIRHTGRNEEEAVLVVDTILKGNKIDRLVIPRAKLSEIGDITRKKSELLGYESTIKALSDDEGVCTYEYIDEITKTQTPVTPPESDQGGQQEGGN